MHACLRVPTRPRRQAKDFRSREEMTSAAAGQMVSEMMVQNQQVMDEAQRLADERDTLQVHARYKGAGQAGLGSGSRCANTHRAPTSTVPVIIIGVLNWHVWPGVRWLLQRPGVAVLGPSACAATTPLPSRPPAAAPAGAQSELGALHEAWQSATTDVAQHLELQARLADEKEALMSQVNHLSQVGGELAGDAGPTRCRGACSSW